MSILETAFLLSVILLIHLLTNRRNNIAINTTKEIVDVIKYNDESVIIVEKLPLPNGTQYKVQYSVINFKTKSIDVLTKNAYLLKKFGSNFNRISQIMPNFVQCDAAVLYDRRVLAIFPNGEAGIFDREGSLNGTVLLNIMTSL